MKKTILILLSLFTFSIGFSQGSSNLGFSQVLNYEYNTSFISYTPSNVGTITVPTGKVWKITSGSAIRRYNGVDHMDYVLIQVGKHVVSGGTVNIALNNCPVWLSSGNYNVFLSTSYSCNEMIGALSIVEFNIE